MLARPPELKERIIFFTDVVSGTQCPKCPEQVTMGADSLQKAVPKSCMGLSRRADQRRPDDILFRLMIWNRC
jgi:hypothetical protein